MKTYLVILFLLIGITFISCAKELTPQEIELMKCEEEAIKLVPSSITLEFESNPFSDETTYRLKKVRWNDDKTILIDRGFKKRTISQDNRYFPLANDNVVENAWFYTDPIYYNKLNTSQDSGLEVEYEFILIPTDAIFYEKKYKEITKELLDDENNGRRVFDIDEIIIKSCKILN